MRRPDAFTVRYDDDDYEFWAKWGQVPEDEATFRLEAQEYEDREAEKTGRTWLPQLGAFKHA